MWRLLFHCLFLVYAFSVFGTEIPDEVYSVVRKWNCLPNEEVIKESLQGIPQFIRSVPKPLWKKASSEVKKEIFPGEGLFHQDFVECVFNTVPDVIKGVDNLADCLTTQSIACVRAFVLLKSGHIEIRNVPYLFCSGSTIVPGIASDLKWLFRTITSYGFTASSGQAFSHSERAFALSLLMNEISLDNLGYRSEDVGGWVLQVHNLSQKMCLTCQSFFCNESPYFIDVNGAGYFVGKDYVKCYQEAMSQWGNFVNFKAGIVSVTDLYQKYLASIGATDIFENRKRFLAVVQPYNFRDIIGSFEKKPTLLFTHASQSYEECLVFKF